MSRLRSPDKEYLAEARAILELPEADLLRDIPPRKIPFNWEAFGRLEEMLKTSKLPGPPEPEETLTAAETYREFLDEALPMTSDLDLGPGLTASEARQVRAAAKRRRF